MPTYRKGAYTIYDIQYHLVWVTKYRYQVLRGEVAERTREILRQVCMSRDIHILKGYVSADHIHMLVSCPPLLSLAKIVQYLKGVSSCKVQEEFLHLKKRYWRQHLWHGATSVQRWAVSRKNRSGSILRSIKTNRLTRTLELSRNEFQSWA